MVVDRQVLIELKAVRRVVEVHLSQLLTYVRLTGLPVGLILNFNVARLTDGVRRTVGASYGG